MGPSQVKKVRAMIFCTLRDKTVESAYKPACKKLTKTAYSGRNQSALIGTTKARGLSHLGQDASASKSLQIAQLGKKNDRMSSTDTGQKTIGRWGIRTHDPLIKSQLLCQLS